MNEQLQMTVVGLW